MKRTRGSKRLGQGPQSGKNVRTCILDGSKANVMLVLPGFTDCRHEYRLRGRVELLLSGSGRNATFVVQSVSLTGTLEAETAELPQFIHVSLTAPSRDANVISRGKAGGSLNLGVRVTYPELGSIASHRAKASRGGLPAVTPISAQLVFSYLLDLELGRFTATGALLLPEFLPFAPGPVGLCCNIECTIADEVECLEMCLDIKVAPDDADKAILSAAKVKGIIRKVNKIWGCGVPGQCCIRFKVRRIIVPLEPRLKKSVLLKSGEYSDDWKETVNIDRAAAPKCYNLYVVDQITVPPGATGIEGQTGYGKDNAGKPLDGSIVSTSGLTDDHLANNIGHELGHSMGLAHGAAADPNGVTGHSTKQTNLMFPSQPGRGGQLNGKQCAGARKSEWLTDTKSHCNLAPDE